jgi:hypothetical protein
MSDEVSKDLTINFHFKKQAAEAVSKDYHEGEKQRIAKTLSDAEVAEKARTEFIRRENRQRIAEESRAESRATKTAIEKRREVAAADKQAAREAAAHHKAYSQGLSTIAGQLTSLVGGISAVGIGHKVFSDMADGAQEASRRIAQMAEEFLVLRDRGRELAGITGNKPNNAFTLDQLRFGAITGQTGDEVRAFRESFQGEAQQFQDRFAPGEFARYEQEVAKIQVKEGLEAGVAGQLGAASIRTLPRGKKNLTAADALAPLQRGFGTLQAGSGSNPVLSQQLSEIIASGVGPEGLFKSMDQAAVAIRTQAQYNASDAGMHIRSIERGFNALDDKQLKALGITEDMDFFEKMEAVRRAFRTSGSKNLAKFLTESGFKDERMNRGMRTHINEGLEGGVITKGFEDAAKVKPADFAAETAEFFADTEQAGSLRVEQAKKEVVKAQLARDRVRIANLMEEADRKTLALRSDPKIRAQINTGDWTTRLGLDRRLGGFKDMDETLQYSSAISIAENQARLAGVPTQNFNQGLGIRGTPLASTKFAQAGKVATDEYLARLIEATERQTKVLEEMKDRPKPLRNGAPNQPPAHP